MKPIKGYAKTYVKGNKSITSVNITPEQAAFIKKYNLNLSAIVRDALIELMSKINKGGAA